MAVLSATAVRLTCSETTTMLNTYAHPRSGSWNWKGGPGSRSVSGSIRRRRVGLDPVQ
jgi:hypothetical protein